MAKRQQRITLADVAEQVGVSTMTISRVINNTGRVSEETRQRVLQVIQDLDYRPSHAARSLASHKTFLLGVVVPDITNPFFAEIVRGIQEVAWENDYSVLLADTSETPDQERAVLDRMDPTLIDCLISCSSRLSVDELKLFVKRQKAVALINRRWVGMGADIVTVHSQLEQRPCMAAEHLLAAGRRRIGFVSLKHHAERNVPCFLATLQQAGISVDDSWYVATAPTWTGGYAGGVRLLEDHPELDAIIGGNDLVALGVMRAVLDSGRTVPGDVAITGGDDTLIASQVSPALTSFKVDTFGMGKTAATLLFERLSGRRKFEPVHYLESIVIRDSAP